ncbi:MAG TPA: CHAT domain-containing protein [Candidatus Dormibacteraeota bacterium]|nr:CHAT domain-containing protein [Candidatus Dormibacteraeota bacterium]
MQYYLATLNAVSAVIENRPQKKLNSQSASAAKLRNALKEASTKIPSLPFLKRSAGIDKETAGILTQTPLMLEVHNDKPVKLVISDVLGMGKQLPPQLHDAVLASFEGVGIVASATVGGKFETVPMVVDVSTDGTIPPERSDSVNDSPILSPAAQEKPVRAPAPSVPSRGKQRGSGWGGVVLPSVGKTQTQRGRTRAKPPEHVPSVSSSDESADFNLQANLDTASFLRNQEGDTTLEEIQLAPTDGGSPTPVASSASLALPVYPDIDIPNSHPVQGSLFDITVSLKFEPSKETSGAVAAPADDKIHVFDIHLLVAKTSRWSKLTFQRPLGTTGEAIFRDVPAPILDGTEETIGGHPVSDICVNFYLENRWCGEAIRRIEVLPSEKSDKLAVIATPETPPWRKDLLVAPGTPPPDLLIRIKKVGLTEFEWSLFSPHMSFPKDPASMRMSMADPFNYVTEHFEIFAGSSLSDIDVNKLNSHCDLIYQAAPKGFRKEYRNLAQEVAKDPLRKSLETIQIVSDEPFIPWELMRVSDPSDESIFPPEILCVKHSVGRWMAWDSTQLRNSLNVKKIAVSASDYKTTKVAGLRPLPWAADERKFLLASPYNAEDIPLQLPKLLDFLQHGSADVIHFSCHGESNGLAPDQAALRTEDDPIGLLAPSVAAVESRAGAGKTHPVVFLNACQAAAGGGLIGMVFGLPQAFLRMGATACIAPLWKVVDQSARDIAEDFYKSTLLGTAGNPPMTLGEALRVIRAQWKSKKSLTHLGYVLYGDPTTTLTR